MNDSFYTYYVELIAVLIAWMEGYFRPDPTIPNTHNNPGDLRKWKDYPVYDGYVWFPTPQEGWNALFRQIELNIGRNLTLTEFFQGKEGVYAGYDKTNPDYAEFVAKYSGIPLRGMTIAEFIKWVEDNYNNLQKG